MTRVIQGLISIKKFKKILNDYGLFQRVFADIQDPEYIKRHC